VVFAPEMIISPAEKMVEATNKMVDPTRIAVGMTEMFFSAAQKITSAAELTFGLASTTAFGIRIIIPQAKQLLPVAGKMLFAAATVVCARQPMQRAAGSTVAQAGAGRQSSANQLQ
jgi:hypothetical protein